MKKKSLINPKSIKLKGVLSVMDKFKLKSIRSASQLKVGDTVFGLWFGAGVIKELILSPDRNPWGGDYNSYTSWMIIDSVDGEWKNKTFSLADNNICNGGYNPWLMFSKEEDAIAYDNWCQQPVGKGVIESLEFDWDDGWCRVPVYKTFSLKCDKKTDKELLALGFVIKDIREYI